MDEKELDWVEKELSELELSDKRLEARAKKIVRNFSSNPSGSIPEFSDGWSESKCTYDFLNNDGVDASAIVSAQREATLERMSEYPFVLALQDTTEINLTHFPKTEGMGPISSGQSRGFLTHTTLAVTPEGVPLGVLAQENWVRDADEIGKSASRRERPIEEKESNKWLKALSESTVDLPAETQVLMVSDRESDVLEYFLHPRPRQVELLARSAQNRCIDNSELLLWQSVRQSPVQGVVTVDVERKGEQLARTATCHIRYKLVTIRPPKNRPASLPKLRKMTLSALLLEEVAVPEGVTPLSWALLTTLPIATFEAACQIIEYYTQRWIIERFHFVLKSGCAIEERRLGHVTAIQRFLALANIVAWRLLWLTYLGRVESDLPCTVALHDFEWKALFCFLHKTQLPPETPPSLQQATRWIAQLGGFLARAADGNPGVKVLWKGWRRLNDLAQAWLIFNPAAT